MFTIVHGGKQTFVHHVHAVLMYLYPTCSTAFSLMTIITHVYIIKNFYIISLVIDITGDKTLLISCNNMSASS